MRKTNIVLMLCLVVLFVASCADKSGKIKVSSKNFSILPPPSDWNKKSLPYPTDSSLSREIASGNIYSVSWRNEEGSSIGLGAVKAVGINGEPLIKTNIFQHSAVAYMKEGHFHDVEKLREICPDLTQEYIDLTYGNEPFKQYEMFQTNITSRVQCDLNDETFPLIFEMVSVWSDSYYYMFQLTTKESNHERDSVVFQEMIDSFEPL